MSDITQLLHKASGNRDPQAQEGFLNAVYEELRIIARAKMANERPGQTIQPTILAHDAWIRLFPEGSSPSFENRAHFFGTVARVMRNILVDRARARLAVKRGGKLHKTHLNTDQFNNIAGKASDELIEAVDGVLNELSDEDAKTVAVVEMKFFLDMKVEEVAKKLGVSESTVGRIYDAFKVKYRSRFENLV